MPALLLSAVSGSPCAAAQFSDYDSPPPTPISQPASRDFATQPIIARKPEPAPARYAPPVHVVPAVNSDSEQRTSQALFEAQTVNGRRNVMQQVSYATRPTVATLSDDSLAQPNANAPAYHVGQVNAIPAYANAAAQNVGLHGYQKNAARPSAVQNQQSQVRTRRPGLQDRISLALKGPAGKRGEPTPAEPTLAEPVQQIQAEAASIETVAYERAERPERVGRTTRPERATQSRGTRSYRQRLVDAEATRRTRTRDAATALAENSVVEHWEAEVDEQPVRENRHDAIADYYDRKDDTLIEFASDEREVGLVEEEIQPVTRLAEVPSRKRPARIAQTPRRTYGEPRSQRTRGRQISVLSTGQDASGSGMKQRPGSPSRSNDFSGFGSDGEPSDRPERGLDSVEDFDPVEDLSNDMLSDRDLYTGRDDDGDNLDDLDDDIESELKRLRDRDDEDLDDDDAVSKPVMKDCETFRSELLNSSIRDIALDISPPASSLPGSVYPVSRSWTDQNGNVLGTGAMQDLRRGYVILDSGQKVAYAKLSEADSAAVSEFWRLPTVCSVGNRGSVQRNWIPQTFTWTASNLCHKTLFFENVQLERYGHSHGPFTQPVQSVAHFFVSLVTVPYQAAIHPANECQYALGYYRPGNCAPWLKDPIPISLDGARRQALFVTGAAFLP